MGKENSLSGRMQASRRADLSPIQGWTPSTQNRVGSTGAFPEVLLVDMGMTPHRLPEVKWLAHGCPVSKPVVESTSGLEILGPAMGLPYLVAHGNKRMS